MKTLACKPNENRNATNEIQELEEALDWKYAQIRARAGRAWRRLCAGTSDPSDACVHVHIPPR